MRVLVTGSRTWPDPSLVRVTLDEVAQLADFEMLVVHGACPGSPDQYASDWVLAERAFYAATGMVLDEEPHPARWREHGYYNPRAGFQRNEHMVNLGADLCVAFIHNNSNGATHCADLAEERGIETRRYLL